MNKRKITNTITLLVLAPIAIFCLSSLIASNCFNNSQTAREHPYYEFNLGQLIEVEWDIPADSSDVWYYTFYEAVNDTDTLKTVFFDWKTNGEWSFPKTITRYGEETWWLTVSDSMMNESWPSNELYVTVPQPPDTLPIPPQNLRAQHVDYYILGDTLSIDSLSIGDTYYLDRTSTITLVHDSLQGVAWIKTRNDDKLNPDFTFSLIVGQETQVYILHDNRIQPKPQWLLDNYDSTGFFVETSDISLELFSHSSRIIYSKGDTIRFGHNGATTGASGMYLVLLRKR